MEHLPTRFGKTFASGHIVPAFKISFLKVTDIAHIFRIWQSADLGAHVISRLIPIVVPACNLDDASEQGLIVPGDYPQRLQVTCAGRLHMETAIGGSRQYWIQR